MEKETTPRHHQHAKDAKGPQNYTRTRLDLAISQAFCVTKVPIRSNP